MRPPVACLVASIVLAPWLAPAPTAHAAAPTCQGKEATIVDNTDGGVVLGTSGDDVIVAGGRNRTVYAGRGDDTICLEDGLVDAGVGHDTAEVRGTAQVDLVRVDGAEDLDIQMGAGRDRLSLRWAERSGASSQTGGGSIDGGPGHDVLAMRHGRVALDLEDHSLSLGRTGHYWVASFKSVFVEARTADLVGDRHRNSFTIEDSSCHVSARGGRGDDLLRLVDPFDRRAKCRHPSRRLAGQRGDDVLRGRDQDDLLIGGPADDSAFGGDGRDTCRAEETTGCER